MRLSALAALMIITTFVLSACSQQTVAALDDHSTQFFGRNAVATRAVTQPGYMPYAQTSGPAHAYEPIPVATSGTVSTDSVSSNDLAPPTGMAPTKPFGTVTPMTTAAASSWSWPVDGQVVKSFAEQGEGIVIAARKGAPIHTVSGGEVAYVGSQMKDYGNLVIVRHPSGEMTSYAHASEIIVKRGDKVKQGDVLGYVGQTGRAPQPQLHFAVRAGERTIDPMTRLPRTMASN